MKCKTEPFSLGVLLTERSAYKTDPVYQRQGSAWNKAKKQLFIDSVINGYDIPKIYLHELGKNDEGYGRYKYAIVDGKQRLEAIWDFSDDIFALADEFEYKKEIISATEKEHGIPEKNFAFRDFNEYWVEQFRNNQLSVVIIEDADEQDIEDLFSRLNNAEPLNSAEQRNARGGDMNRLIRNIADEHIYFRKNASYSKQKIYPSRYCRALSSHGKKSGVG